MITAFVAVMLLAVEYLNVRTRGASERALRGSRLMQYVVAVGLGMLPGCLGAFTVVALYTHRVVTLGALAGAMLAASGDEAFVMLALFPETAVGLMLCLGALGLLLAPVVDRLAGAGREPARPCVELSIHPGEWRRLSWAEATRTWRKPSVHRVLLCLVLCVFAGWIVVGGAGIPGHWNWVRTTLLALSLFALFVVASVPDHFLREHLFRHVLLQHVPRLFGWTAAVLVGLTIVEGMGALRGAVRANPWSMLLSAGALGVIPESGPHLLFVTLFASGDIPLSVLLTSTIVQDGHGMLPLLAQSRRDFIRVKAINLAAGLALGAAMLLLGR